ncbi:MAG: sulfur carrier protein ThiS [Leptothrix sp. (in: b-proteobacteria)]
MTASTPESAAAASAGAAALHVSLNGAATTLAAGSTLAELLASHAASASQSPESYASAINGQFVPRGRRAATVLADGDAVTLFQAIVGG